jgi:hypothetical protein
MPSYLEMGLAAKYTASAIEATFAINLIYLKTSKQLFLSQRIRFRIALQNFLLRRKKPLPPLASFVFFAFQKTNPPCFHVAPFYF